MKAIDNEFVNSVLIDSFSFSANNKIAISKISKSKVKWICQICRNLEAKKPVWVGFELGAGFSKLNSAVNELAAVSRKLSLEKDNLERMAKSEIYFASGLRNQVLDVAKDFKEMAEGFETLKLEIERQTSTDYFKYYRLINIKLKGLIKNRYAGKVAEETKRAMAEGYCVYLAIEGQSLKEKIVNEFKKAIVDLGLEAAKIESYSKAVQSAYGKCMQNLGIIEQVLDSLVSDFNEFGEGKGFSGSGAEIEKSLGYRAWFRQIKANLKPMMDAELLLAESLNELKLAKEKEPDLIDFSVSNNFSNKTAREKIEELMAANKDSNSLLGFI